MPGISPEYHRYISGIYHLRYSRYISGNCLVYFMLVSGIRHISGIFQTYLRHISSISCKSKAYLRHKIRISQAYSRNISGTYQPYPRCTSFQTYLRNISRISHAYYKQIFNGHIKASSQAYPRYVSDILRHILGMYQNTQ